jgi:drug/metabolite transporter (DMT)-like permease
VIYLVLTILCQTAMTFCMKYADKKSSNRFALMTFCYAVCTIVGYIFLKSKELFPNNIYTNFTMLLAVLNGIILTIGLYANIKSVTLNGAPLTAMFSKLGVLIPTIVSIFIFNERPSFLQVIGIVAAVFAIVYLYMPVSGGGTNNKDFEDNKKKPGSHITNAILLLIIFMIEGSQNLNSKIYNEYAGDGMKDYYTFYTFLVCLVISLVLMLRQNREITGKDIMGGIIIGVPNVLILVFTLSAVALLPASIIFPASSAGVILLVNIINFLLYHEKPTRKEIITIGIVATALVLINL